MTRFCLSRNNSPLQKQQQEDQPIPIKNSFPAFCGCLGVDAGGGTHIGIDSHPSEHTAVAINRFEEEKGVLRFENTQKGIKACIQPKDGEGE
jgi:hypothetical protein